LFLDVLELVHDDIAWGKWATIRNSPPSAAAKRRNVLTYMSD
jgi:hypothetical protein